MNQISIDKLVASLRQQPVKGFFSEEEGRELAKAVRDAQSQSPIVEIGSYCGLSTCYLAAAAAAAKKVVYAVDHHEGSEEHQPGEEYCDTDLINQAGSVSSFELFKQTIKRFGFEDVIVPVVARSELVARHWRTPISLLFIDGGHSFEQAFADLTHWSQHVEPMGQIYMHDIYDETSAEGQAPRLALEQFLASTDEQWIAHQSVGSLWLLRKAMP